MDHGTKYPWERAEIAKKIVQKSFDHWIKEFTRINIPFAPIYTLKETLGSSHIAANAMLRKVNVGDSEAMIPAFPVEVRAASGERVNGTTPRTPNLGEHNADILKAIGLSELVGIPLNLSQ
jgi:crotonobetainyl-CoA:carnitine CoA-transferase CaiB-like acyl-CoA transferase